MLKLPSLQKLFLGFVAVIKRFPLEILASIIGTTAAMVLIENENEFSHKQIQILVRILLCSILALTLFLSVSVFVEQQKISMKNSVLLRLLSVALIVGLFFFLHPIDNETNIFRYGFLFAAFHLLVSFAPYIRAHHISAFWEYNKRLFLRILAAVLYSSVLYAGLCIAIVSTDVLFTLDLDGKIYAHLGFFIFGIFNTAFFLAGVPASWTELEEHHIYPKGLKIFTQFVLIPLATIYLGILLTYEGKVILEWSLPKGVVSSLVLGYAVYGILSILLIHPIRHDEGNRWIKIFSKLFYILLIPLIVLLGVAIWARIQQYGITESRYTIIILSLWLTGITVYFLVSKSQNIKLIPVSLCVLALLSIWGPQSASSVSFRSQINRLVAFFEKHNSVKDGKLISLDDTKKDNDGWEITTFIIERYGAESLQSYLSVNVDSLTSAADTIKSRYSRERERMDTIRSYLGLRYESKFQSNYDWHDYESLQDTVQISGYAWMKRINYYDNNNSNSGNWDSRLQTFAITGNTTATFELKSLAKSIMTDADMPASISVENSERNVKLVIEYISFSDSDSTGIELGSLRGYLLVKE